MKNMISVFFVACTLSAAAMAGTVLGIPEGTYTGNDILIPEAPLVPTLDYSTKRILQNGTIIAETKGSLLGHELGGASAKLKVKMLDANRFLLLDMQRPGPAEGYTVAGSGSCTNDSCTFAVTVMGGALKLRETWSRGGPNEFYILNGWQSLNGITGRYTGRLVK